MNKKPCHKDQKSKFITTGIAGTLLASMAVNGATFNDLGDGVTWEDPLNWDTGRVPGDDGAGGLDKQNIVILSNSQVVFDADTWSYLSANSLLHSATEYRGALRLLMGESTSGSTDGSHSLTFDHGAGNLVNFDTNAGQGIGTRVGKTSTLNIQSGTVNVGGNPMTIGGSGIGIFNLGGGSMIFGRSAPNIGTSTGSGEVNITGGSFTTRVGLNLGSNGAFNVIGSASTQIGLGSSGSLDGVYTQAAGGVLGVSIDIGGVTKIFVDDTGEGKVAATFAAGSLLDVGFAGAPVSGTWTVLELEGADIVDNGLAFAPEVDTGIWSFNIDNTGANGLLTVTAVAPTLVWDGTPDGNWDIGSTANWQGGLTYSEPTVAIFNDTLSGNSTVNLTDTFSAVNVLVDNSTNDYTFTGTGQLSGVTGLVKSGTGELTLGNTGGNDFSGPLQINNGTLTLGNATAFGGSGSPLDVNGGTVDLGGFSVTKSTTDITGGSINNGTLTSPVTAGAGTINANLEGSSTTVTKTGSGTLILTGTNTYDGTTFINGGTLQLGSNSALGTSSSSTSTSTVTVENEKTVDAITDEPILLVDDPSGLLVGDTAAAVGIPDGAVITEIFGNEVTLDLAPTVDDPALLVTFSRESEVTVTVILGDTKIGAAATLDLNGSTTSDIITLLNGAGVGGNGAIINSNPSTPGEITTDIVSVGLFSVGGAGDLTLPNVIQPNGVTRRITKVGAGTLTLAGDSSNNRYGLTVTEGNVILAKTSGEAISRFPLIMNNAASTVTLTVSSEQINNSTDANGIHEINEGTLDLNGFNESIAALGGTGTGGIVTNSNSGTTSTFTLLSANADTEWAGAISGNLNLVKTGVQVQTLTGTLSYTGDTTVDGGTLSIPAPTLGDASSISVGTGAILDLNFSGTDNVGTLTLGGVEQAIGEYGAIGSGAANQVAEITGTGRLNVTGAAGSDYDTWAATFLPDDVSNMAGDNDNDQLLNEFEYAFGLDPTSSASVNPISVQLDKTTGTFTYTRRDPALTGLTYTVETSTTLSGWTPDAGATQTPGVTDGDGNQTVVVTLSSVPTDPSFFVRVISN